MTAQNFHGASHVSYYLGVSLTSVHNWRADAESGFPEPRASITGLSGMRPVYGWAEEQLPELRTWYCKRFSVDEVTAEERWKVIDEELASGIAHKTPSSDNCAGQYAIFSIPNQRAA